MDRISKQRRSWNMGKVKSKNTVPELIVRSFLHQNGFRFRLHRKDLPGCPDIVLPKYNTVIFVHGCFWHRHEGCKRTTTPDNNSKFWQEKFRRNVERDIKNQAELVRYGWKVILIWECEAKSGLFEKKLINQIIK